MILLFDTSTTTGYLALGDSNQVISSATWQAEQSHSRELPPRINVALKSAQLTIQDLTHIAVGVGPGSFTGLRVALATAKGLAIACETPLLAITSMKFFAASSAATTPYIVTLTDAFRGEIYVGVFDTRSAGRLFHPVGEILSMTPSTAIDVIRALGSPFTLTGTGYMRYKTLFAEALGEVPAVTPDSPDFQSMLRVASEYACANRVSDPAALLPYYVREAEAVEKKQQGRR